MISTKTMISPSTCTRTTSLDAAKAICVAALCACGDNIAATPIDAGVADAGIDAALLPDLTLNLERARIDMAISERDFSVDSCELDADEMCVAGPGLRRLLYFSIETPNIGNADLVLGQPSADNEAFEYSECHDHFHYEGYATYELIGPSGSIAVGRKQAFCLLDTSVYVTDDPTVNGSRRYSCSFQGIQRGWADLYDSRTPCQFLDITDVPDGDYQLRVELNADRTLPESNYDNNVFEIPITLGDSAIESPTEPCDATDPRNIETANRECGWQSVGVFGCTPGFPVSVGCGQNCGSFSLGDCSGDPMLRVCDATRADGNCSFPSALGFSDNACGDVCPIVFDADCPASGMIEVFSAAKTLGEPFVCNLELQE